MRVRSTSNRSNRPIGLALGRPSPHRRLGGLGKALFLISDALTLKISPRYSLSVVAVCLLVLHDVKQVNAD